MRSRREQCSSRRRLQSRCRRGQQRGKECHGRFSEVFHREELSPVPPFNPHLSGRQIENGEAGGPPHHAEPRHRGLASAAENLPNINLACRDSQEAYEAKGGFDAKPPSLLPCRRSPLVLNSECAESSASNALGNILKAVCAKTYKEGRARQPLPSLQQRASRSPCPEAV